MATPYQTEDRQAPEPASPPPEFAGGDIIDLRYLFIAWLKWIWVPVLTALVGAYFGYQNLISFTPQYVASMTVLPAGGFGSGAATAGQMEAIANAIGLGSMGRDDDTRMFVRMRQILGSVVLAERMQEKYGLMQIVFAGSWDETTQSWKRPEGPEFERDQRTQAFLRRNPWSPPDIQSLANYLGGAIQIGTARLNPFKKLSAVHEDPEFALWILETVFFEAEETLRERDRLDLAQRKAYIESQLDRQSKVHIQNALLQELAVELGREVALEASSHYAAKVIERAYVRTQRTEPDINMMFGVPIVLGGIIGFLFITLLAVFRRESR